MASIEYLVHIDLAGNELQNAVIQNLSTAPGSPSAGQIYYDIEDTNIYMWDGALWIDLTSQGSGSTNLSFTASPTTGTVTSSTGTDATITVADGTNSGLMIPAHYTLVANIISGTDYGDITTSASGATWTIDAGAVTLAKMADVATSTIFYRKTAGTGSPEVQTLATLKTDLGLTGTNSGDQTITLTGQVSGTGTGSFATTLTNTAISAQTELTSGLVSTDELLVSDAGVLKRMDVSVLETYMQDNLTITTTLSGLTDTTIATLASGNILVYDGTDSWDNKVMSGDATIASTGALTIANNAVTLAKMADVATGTIFYRKTAATGDPEVQTLATLKTDLGLTGTNSGDQTITLTGDVTGTGTGSFATTISASSIEWGMLDQTWVITQAEGIGSNDNETSIPTSAAVKDYVDNAVTGTLIYQGGYNASTDTPSLDDGTPIAGILIGHTYTVTVAGDFFTEAVQVGDMLIAEIDSPTVLADWTTVNKNIPDIVDASETAKGLVEEATDAEVTAGTATGATGAQLFVTPAKLATHLGAEGTESAVVRRKTFNSAAATTTTCAHGFNNLYCIVQVWEVSTGLMVMTEVDAVTVDSLNVNFNVAATASQYKIIIIG